MSEWYGDVALLDEDISIEEAVATRWEEDMTELMAEDWEEIMGGPDDEEFERMEALAEERLAQEIEKELKEAWTPGDRREWDEDMEGNTDAYEDGLPDEPLPGGWDWEKEHRGPSKRNRRRTYPPPEVAAIAVEDDIPF